MKSAAPGSGRLLSRTDFDPNVRNVARICDWLLGGKVDFAAGRQAAAGLLGAVPAVWSLDLMAPGSYLVISHVTADHLSGRPR